ncbi:MAG: hypothetical protein RL732_415, partial [Bacteroidota bacterium]
LEKENMLLFIGTPWFRNMDEVRAHGLTLNDFSKSDPMVDLLHVLKTEEIVSKDAVELLAKINFQKKEFETAAEQLTLLISNLHSGILLEDNARHIILTNDSFCQLFGIPASPSQLKGMDCSNSAEETKILFKDPVGFVKGIEKLLAEKQKVTGEVLELADGRFFERDFIPLFVDEQYKGHLWHYTDITARLIQQKLLQKSEEKYRRIITNINLGLIEVDINERIQYVNRGFCEASGFTEEELIGQYPGTLFKLDEETINRMKEVNESRKKGESNVNEVVITMKNGEKRWLAISGTPLYDEKGNVSGSMGIHMDISEQKQLEAELREAKLVAEKAADAKESFLANMSHEIRTPLSGIYGMAQLLQNTRLNEEQHSYLNAIEKAIENLQTIINDILDLSKINAGMMVLETISFSLQEELQSLYKLHLTKASSKNLELSIYIDPALSPYHLGDPSRIGQVVNNLLSNAIKFTDTGEVSVRCEVAGATKGKQEVLITVSDTGIGMDEKFIDQIFDKFTQEDKGHSRKYGGTGLGMSICRNLVKLMNGTISISSRKFNGTHINISLPLPVANPVKKESSTQTEQGRLTGCRILLAEDNDINARVVQSILSREGARVALVKDGKKMIDTLQEQSFDLVISDVQMPKMSGLEAVKWVRKNLHQPIKIVALTANALPEEKEKCFKAGFDQVIFKPFKKEELMSACINNLQDKKSASSTPVNDKARKLYDLELLSEMVEHDKNQMDYLLQQFFKETPRKLTKLKKALADKNKAEIRKIAHYLSSSVHHLGIDTVFEAVDLLENGKLDRSPKKMQDTVISLIEQLHKALVQLKKDMGREKGPSKIK